MQSVQELWQKFWDSPNSELKNAIAENYLTLVKIVVSRVAANLPSHVDRDDLNVCGALGLLDAIDKYDPHCGVKFETYASTRIRGAVLDELRGMDWIPRSTRKKAQQLEHAYNELRHKLNRYPTEQEVADFLEVSIDKLNQMLSETAAVTILSLDAQIEGEGSDSLRVIDSLEDQKSSSSPSFTMEMDDVKKLLADAIEELPVQDRNVLALYYYERLMLKEIGQVLSVSESRVSQIHTRAVLQLKSKLKKHMENFIF